MKTRTLQRRTGGLSQKKLRQILGSPIALGLAIVMTGCASNNHSSKSGESVADAATTTRVKRALSHDTAYRYSDIQVVTWKGNVQLSGFVENTQQKDKATYIAQAVTGVKQVENRLALK